MEQSFTPEKQSYADTIAEKIIKALEDGTAPWTRPWKGSELMNLMPTNPITNKTYRGMNFVNLSLEQVTNGYTDPRWLTYKQAKGIGAQVRYGEHGTVIQYWKFNEEVERTDEKGNPLLGEDGKPLKATLELESPRVFYSTVFNANQIENMPELKLDNRTESEKTFEAIEAAENIIQNSGAYIKHRNGDRAFYDPLHDDITLPLKEQFLTSMDYYSTATHELGHWTGHGSRLNRDLSDSYGTEGYAREELRAEIASYILSSELGLNFDPTNHHAYIKSWVSILSDQPNEIFKAAADASKISQFLQGLNMEAKQDKTISQETTISKTTLEHFDETNLANRVTEAKYNNYKIPLESVEDAIARYGTIRLDDSSVNITWAELNVDGEKYMLNTNKSYGVITPRDKWNDTSFDDLKSKHSTITILSHTSTVGTTRFDEKSLINYFQADPHRSMMIPKSAVEDAIARYGTMEIKDEVGKLVEIKIDNKLYELSVDNGEDGHINPKDYMDQTPFEQNAWEGSTTTVLVPQNEAKKVFEKKTFLSVPYAEKEIAKQYGAKWDKDQKLWYAPAGADFQKLSQFSPEIVETKAIANSLIPTDQREVLAEFKKALEDRGLIINGDPIMDTGKIVRVPVQSDKHGELSGAYIGYTDGRPAGVIQNFKTGAKDKWVASGAWQSVSPEAEQAQRAKIAQNKEARELERVETHNEVSKEVNAEFKEAPEATNNHPYLLEKGVLNHGLKLDARGNLLMPLSDINGKMWTVQHIGINGYKGFEPGGKKEGNFFLIGAKSISDVNSAVICEGYATGASIHEAIKAPVIIAVDAYNLINVANAIHEKFPSKPIVIAADNDIQKEEIGKPNVGRLQAEAAAKAVKGTFIVPRFTSQEILKGATDFNDLFKSRGLSEVKKQLELALDVMEAQERGQVQTNSQDKTKVMQRELKRQVVRQNSFQI
ncbi:MAG: zincin-like metallopeptidase domain-containing protein [Bacilli bacterium]|nr:zincin-like metallopeptidase domain-containing protein [Bacilli bacterium]